MGRSQLNAHKFAIGFSECDKCLCDRPETVSHYLNDCFLYQVERHALNLKLCQILPNFNLLPLKLKTKVLLEGIHHQSEESDSRNLSIILAVQGFILQTKRFQ